MRICTWQGEERYVAGERYRPHAHNATQKTHRSVKQEEDAARFYGMNSARLRVQQIYTFPELCALGVCRCVWTSIAECTVRRDCSIYASLCCAAGSGGSNCSCVLTCAIVSQSKHRWSLSAHEHQICLARNNSACAFVTIPATRQQQRTQFLVNVT